MKDTLGTSQQLLVDGMLVVSNTKTHAGLERTSLCNTHTHTYTHIHIGPPFQFLLCSEQSERLSCP